MRRVEPSRGNLEYLARMRRQVEGAVSRAQDAAQEADAALSRLAEHLNHRSGFVALRALPVPFRTLNLAENCS